MEARRIGRRPVLGALAMMPALALSGFAPAATPRTAPRTAPWPDGELAALRAEAAALDQLRAVVVAQGGRVVLAEAFRGPAVERAVNVKSISKTIVALLTGVAIGRGLIPDTGASIGDLAPRLIPAGADRRVAAITVADLLTMQAGLERTSGANYGRWVESPNWVAHALSRPLVAEPGRGFLYSTGSFHVLGAVLATVADQSLLALARDWLGAPLGIEIPAWTRDPQGFYLGGNEMALAPMALIRIGEMARAGGIWQGARVLPEGWIERSWQARARSPFSGHDYGYGWFLAEARGHRVAYARGYGGQMLYAVPGLELTVAVTSDPTRPGRSAGHVGALNRLLAEIIVPAAEG